MQPYRFSDRHRARDTTGATAIYLPPGSIVGPLKCKAQRVASRSNRNHGPRRPPRRKSP